MDEPATNKIEVEEVQVRPDHDVTYNNMLEDIKQSTYGFREVYGNPTDAELPVVLQYESNGQMISLLSSQSSTITIQVSSSTGRLSYVYDPAEEHAVTVHHFTQQSETPTESFGLLPTDNNTRQLVSIHAYIQDALDLAD